MLEDGIRTDWMQSLISRSQRLAGALNEADPEDVPAILSEFAQSLTAAPDRLHNLVAGAILVDVADRVDRHLHQLAGRSGPCSCRIAAPLSSTIVLNWNRADVRTQFREWAARFFEVFARSHPASDATRIALAIRRSPAQKWTWTTLRGSSPLSTRTLAREFCLERGVPLKTYIHLARLQLVLQQLDSDTKIDVVAAEAGYRSKKDLYQAMRRLVGTTPREYRRRPLRERQRLAARVRDELAIRTSRRPPRRAVA